MIFEYKVKCRHGLGWKEIVLYADTDIEEFFNRNSINYVRNMTDTIENRQLKEIERLKNIIKEVREILKFHLSNPSGTKNGWHIDIWSSEDISKLNELLEILDKGE